MAGYYEQKHSNAANWCFRLALFAVPLLLLTIYSHRIQAIETQQTFWLLAVTIALIIIAILLGVRAAIDMWEKGYKGGRKTVNGITLATLLLLPFGYQLILALENPRLNDLATDVANPPVYLSAEKLENYSAFYDFYASKEIVTSYPEVTTRRYNAPVERVYRGAEQLMKNWRWTLITGLNIPEKKQEVEEVKEGELAGAPKDVVDVSDDEILGQEIIIQALAKSMILKLDHQVVIRLTPDVDGTTLVDMRSRSQWAPHDFGSNSKNIKDFLNALDIELAGVAGETS